MSSNLGDFIREFPLPPGWSEPEVHTKTVEFSSFQIRLVGLVSKNGRREIFGSAGSIGAEDPFQRAFFELLERIALLDSESSNTPTWPCKNLAGEMVGQTPNHRVFPESKSAIWQYAKSNGVALGSCFSTASDRAKNELVERDLIQRSWYGATGFESLPTPEFLASSDLASNYKLLTRNFGSRFGVSVTGLFAFPLNKANPFVYGFGAAESLEPALEKSVGEFLQRLGFLWEEEIPVEPPAFSTTAYFHQEYYLNASTHWSLREWLESPVKESWMLDERQIHDEDQGFSFIDLTPDDFPDQLFVVKAIHSSMMPLTFGKAHPWVSPSLPERLQVHPIA